MKIDSDNLDDFIRGAAFLGTGGGGDPYVGRLMLSQVLQDGKTVRIIDPQDIDDDALAVNILTMGAPTVINEKIPSGPANVAALRRMEEELGRTVDYVMPIEAGGVNATIPLVVGALAGLPIVDADAMGRAFPELQMTTFNVAGLSSGPNIIADDKETVVSITTASNLDAERYCRDVCVRMGGAGQMVCYPISGKQVREHAVLNTITMAVRIGETIRLSRKNGQDVFDALIGFLTSPEVGRKAGVIFDGKVLDLVRETRGGFSVGNVVIGALDGADRNLVITFQNEYLLAQLDGRPVGMVPDLLCIVDRETGEPITTENLKYGQRIKLIGISAPASMRSKRALSIFGPDGFGLDVPYTAIEEIGAWAP